MKIRSRIYRMTILAVVCLWISVGSSHAQRTFTSQDGKTLSGKITAANSEKVTILMSNGKTIEGGVSFFSKADQAYIAEWIKKHPVQTAYDFTVKASRAREDRRKRSEGSHEVVYEKWAFKIEVENRSRSGQEGADLEGLIIEYNVVKTANAEASEARYLHQGLSSGGRGALVLSGKLDVPTLAYLKKKELKTDTISIASSELSPDYVYRDGSRAEAQDDLEGIWVKIVKDGKAVFEEKIGTKRLETVKWQAP